MREGFFTILFVVLIGVLVVASVSRPRAPTMFDHQIHSPSP